MDENKEQLDRAIKTDPMPPAETVKLMDALKEENSHLKHTITRITEHNTALTREVGRLKEENLQLNRYNNDLLVSERNLRAQIDELNAHIDDREKQDITPTQMVAMMEAVFMRWSE